MEIFGHAGKLFKNIKNQANRSNWSKEGVDGMIHMLAMPFGMISADGSHYGKKLRPRHSCIAFI
jgi:hypothetical protein